MRMNTVMSLYNHYILNGVKKIGKYSFFLSLTTICFLPDNDIMIKCNPQVSVTQ
jgi:hypothetical protein